jgi:magnesium transporter
MGDNTAAESHTLPRALTKPVRAMGRIWTGPPSSKHATEARPTRDAIVDCGLYIGGHREPGKWHYTEALAAARTKDGFVWLGLKEPEAAQLAEIAETFGLHELAVEDAVKSAQRPKVEKYGDMTFVALRTARYVEHEELTEQSEVVETGDVLMFIGQHFIISVRHGEACDLAPVRAQLETRPDLLKFGPWAVAYAVYDLVVDVMLDVAVSFDEDIAALEEYVFARDSKQGSVQRVYHLKRELMEFRRAVIPLQPPIEKLASGQVDDVPVEIRRYFRDVYDHLTRLAEQVLYFDDLLNSILQARLTQVTVDQNNDMRKIAAWAGIAAVWTAVAGVYGMNFAYMPELHWQFGYPVVLALMIGISLALYRAFRKSGWL